MAAEPVIPTSPKPIGAILSLSAIALIPAFLAAGCGPNLPDDVQRVTITGTAGSKTFDLKLALDDASRAKGLGGVTEISEDGGMLFAFAHPEVRFFWMKGCVIDIDIAFLDGLGVVTAVHTMPKEPPKGDNESEADYESRLKHYSSGVACQYAIEVRPGTFDTLGIKRGSRIQLDTATLKARVK
jgi:uncharacterized membrane protein (UPF0127 family)